jgi:hypothetical protein
MKRNAIRIDGKLDPDLRSAAYWHSKPGFLKAKNATNTANKMGNGCGRIGKGHTQSHRKCCQIKVRYLSKEDSLLSSCYFSFFGLSSLIEETVESFSFRWIIGLIWHG